VKIMRTLKHLPLNEWPAADREVFRVVHEPGDVFDDTGGPGAHLSEGSRRMIRSTYRRWLGFLKAKYPDELSVPPDERITLERVRAFIDHLSGHLSTSSVAIAAAHLYNAARLMAPTTDWAWLRSIKSRLACRARPADRLDRLVPPVQTLNFGIELMDAAFTLPISRRKQREIQYRNGLLLAPPEEIGLIPGVLQHASPEPGEQHYNLARSMQAGQRFAIHLANARSRLRLLANKSGIRLFHERVPAGRPSGDQDVS
jgi:hypothetical protein